MDSWTDIYYIVCRHNNKRYPSHSCGKQKSFKNNGETERKHIKIPNPLGIFACRSNEHRENFKDAQRQKVLAAKNAKKLESKNENVEA